MKTQKVIKKLEFLTKELKRREKVNLYSPFPIYDTGDIEDLKKEIMDIDYNKEEVDCCKECKWLHIIKDEDNNWWCDKCNTPNSIETCSDIDEYLQKYGDIWTYY